MADLPIVFVDNTQDLTELGTHLQKVKRFAFDTEFVTEDTFTPILCLVQVATSERITIIDPLAVPELSRFWNIVADPDYEVVAHAANAEIRFCRQYVGRSPAMLFDVQIAAGLVGYGYPLSYSSLVRCVRNQTVRGHATRTEWRKRPLTKKQIDYAADDVRHLLPIHDQLTTELKDAGRLEWANAEFCDRLGLQDVEHTEPWKRVSKVHSLNRRQLAILRELAQWREEEAKRRDRPLRSVATDDILCEISRSQPTSTSELQLLRGMNRRNLRRVTSDLVSAVNRGMTVPDVDCPSLPPKPDDSERVRMLTGILSAAFTCICAKENLPPNLVASTSELNWLVRSHLKSGEFPAAARLTKGWRNHLFGRLFVDLLEGRLCLRVADASSSFPIVIEP